MKSPISGTKVVKWEELKRMPERCANSLRRDTERSFPVPDHSIPTTTEETTENEIPYGYCHCGCGQKTTVSRQNHAKKGYVKGEPRRFIAGHHNLPTPVDPESNTSGVCQCGCGRPTGLYRQTDIGKGAIKGSRARYLPGHSPTSSAAPRFRIAVDGDVAALTATRGVWMGKTMLLDVLDLSVVGEASWVFAKHGEGLVCQSRKYGLLHRHLVKPSSEHMVDHLNGNTLDNRRSNLRICSRAENVRNAKSRSDGISPYKGVQRSRRCWVASIKVDGNVLGLGSFEKEVEAAQAYDKAARIYFKEFARLNFPKDGEQSALICSIQARKVA